MRLISFLAAIMVLFALADPSAAQVRYSITAAPTSAPGSARDAGLRFLTWPGKVMPQEAQPQSRMATSSIRPNGMAQRFRSEPAPSYTSPAYVSPARYSPLPVAEPSQPDAALPTSIYAPPPPARIQSAPIPAPAARAAAPVRALAMASPPAAALAGVPTGAAGEDPPASPRFYSLHRAYGDTPDPIPLTPTFFSDGSTDLAAPPPPVPRAATTATGQVLRPVPPDPDSGDPAAGG